MKLYKRHIVKSITWRLVGSLDTFMLAYVFSGDINIGLRISGFEVISKMILYYIHERIWFGSSLTNSKKRHAVKTITWRLTGTLDTIIISLLVTGNPFTGLKIGGAETLSKMLLYYFHERIWYKINFGLKSR